MREKLVEAIEFRADAVPYLAPEIVLLFKAKSPQGKAKVDLATTLPTLSPEQIGWLRQALGIVHPNHNWMALLDPPCEPGIPTRATRRRRARVCGNVS
jgi:hypothetical protein